MRSLLTQAATAQNGWLPDTLLCLTAPVRVLHGISSLFGLGESSLAYSYVPPARVQDFASVGIGHVLRLCEDGSAAIQKVQTAADALRKRVVHLRAPGCEHAPSLRLFGGFRFALDATRQTAEDPWQDFPDASFVLPRWTVFADDRQSFLQLVLGVEELRGLDDITAQLDEIERALGTDRESGHPIEPVCVERTEQPSRQEYCALVNEALAAIANGALHKVVPARRLLVRASAPFSTRVILDRLRRSYADCCRFALYQKDSAFVGATPELLIRKRGSQATTEALAGTRARSQGMDDALLVSSLLEDDKEAREHAHVTDQLVRGLRPYCAEAVHVGDRSIRTLRNLHHLCTPISATLRETVSVLDLLSALHPTPAVCGLPQAEAARFLSAQESFSRGLYAAPVGHFDLDGNGCFWVAIRSALIRDSHAWLYAGAGVVAGSVAQKEYEETAAKFGAMLGALGVST